MLSPVLAIRLAASHSEWAKFALVAPELHSGLWTAYADLEDVKAARRVSEPWWAVYRNGKRLARRRFGESKTGSLEKIVDRWASADSLVPAEKVPRVTAATFGEEVLKSTQAVVLHITTYCTWCEPCMESNRTLDDFAGEDLDGVKFERLVAMTVDEAKACSERGADVTKIPALSNFDGLLPEFLIYSKGKQVASKPGQMTRQELSDWMRKNLPH